MKNKSLIITLLAIFLFSISLRLPTLNQIGRTWDEPEYVEQGYKMIELIEKGDFNNKYFYTTYDHPPLVKYLYGLTAHLDSERQLPNGEIALKYDLTYSRLLSALIFSLGVIITTLIGWRLISPIIGIISGILLAMLPFTLGLSQLVTAESFKIFIYPLSFYSYINLIKKNTLKNIILAGFITGIALQIKQSNGLLIPLFIFMYLLYYKQYKYKEKKLFSKKILSIIWITIISIFVFVLLWPSVLFNFKSVYAIHSSLWNVQFSPKLWQITLSPPEVFFGRLMMTPVFYYVIYFFISVPTLILVFFFYGFKRIYKKKNWILFSFLIWFALPFIMSFYSWRQHGLRYIIEIYPAIAIIAAIGLDSFFSKFTYKQQLKLLYFIPIIIYLFFTLRNIKPYYLDYFNELVGGTNTVYKYKLFQQGWWGQGIREAGLYIKNNVPKGSAIGYALSPDHVLPRFDGFKYEKWSKNKKYDYVLVNYYNIIREGFNDDPIKKNYKLIYQVRADKAVLVFIYSKK